MGDVLSQNEIDNLLQALSSGELDAEEIKDSDEKQIKNYDFARPAKFSKDGFCQQTFRFICERQYR